MKSSCISLLIIFLIGVCSTSVLSVPPDKITICHKQACPEGDVHSKTSITLEITENALQSHLNHGDTVGVCVECDGDECDVGCESDVDCNEVEVCDTETGKCVDTNQSCDEVICNEGFACVFGKCFALAVNDGTQGPTGPGGSNGLDGQDGSSCTVTTIDNCAAINCDDGTSALVCNGQDGVSCTVKELSGSVLVSCPDGTSVDVGNANFDDDSDGITNDVDQCPGTPQGFVVDEFGCMLVQKQPPSPDLEECDSDIDLFGRDQEEYFYCGMCGNGCQSSLAMLLIGLAFLRKRGV